jgi:outer membrane autotransporter protein
MGGADKALGDGLAAGFDLALVSDRFEAGGRQDADASSQGLFLGVHGSFAPDAWNGAYLLGGVRFGFDVNRMQRSVSAGAYHRSHDSEWTGWSGAFMLGAGRDWFFGEEKSVRLGPLATIQYAFTSHPDFEEDGAEALRTDGGTADSLGFLLGAHLGASKGIGSGCRLDAELMAGWRHELLEGTIRTRAAFAENPSASFTSARRLSTRDAGVLQASLRIAHEGGFFAELDLGGEARTAGAGVTGGLRVGFEF